MIPQSNKELYNMMMETRWRVIFVCDVSDIYIYNIINKPTKQSKWVEVQGWAGRGWGMRGEEAQKQAWRR